MEDPDFNNFNNSITMNKGYNDRCEGSLKSFHAFPTMTLHPLLVDHIVEKVLDYVSVDGLHQLLNLRQVCSSWNYYATKILEKKLYLSFGGHKYNVGRLKAFLQDFETFNSGKSPSSYHCDEGSSCSSEDFSSVYDSNNNDYSYYDSEISFPVTRFRLFSDLFQECNKSAIVNFMRKCGPVVESLVIFKDINSDIEYTSDELVGFLFPQLKELTFSDRRRSTVSHDATTQSLFYQIVSSAKDHLTKLSIKFPREPIYEIYEKEELVIKMFQQCKMPHLRYLKLDMSITDKILMTLTELPLQLTTLHLSLGASVFTPEVLKALLNKLRFTLKDLRITDLYRRASLVVDFPKLENLHSFEIHGLELPAYFISFPDFTYQTKMPNLRNLRLTTWAPIKPWEVFVPQWEKEEELPALVKSVENVQELSLAMNFDCPLALRRISNMFVNVINLEMHFSRGSIPALQIVFQFMPQLKELKLNQSYLGEIATNCIDDVLTGLSADECKLILKKKSYKDMDITHVDKRPCLLDLKNLRKFDMLGLRHRNMVTDVSAYLVFMKLKQLSVLDIGRSEFSETCLKDLATRFPNGKFYRYLSKKRMKSNYDPAMYKTSIFTSICVIQ